MAFRPLERLNARERRLVSGLGAFFGVALILAVPVGLESVVHAREADNQELAAALTAVQEARGPVRERQEKKEALLQRYARKAPPLAGYLEQAAQQHLLEVENSDDRPEVPHGKRYVERSTTVRLKKSGLLPIVRFLESLEKSGYPLEVSRLAMRKRMGEPDSYDVEVGVTAYDRADAVSAPAPGLAAGLPGLPGLASASAGSAGSAALPSAGSASSAAGASAATLPSAAPVVSAAPAAPAVSAASSAAVPPAPSAAAAPTAARSADPSAAAPAGLSAPEKQP